jgi:hypothetical protein
MVRLEPCDRDALAAALRLINEARDRGEVRDGRGVNLHAAAINLDRIREDYDNAEDIGPRCDDPGAHRPGCQCDGGEPLL